jgi:hypothetical protein
VKYPLPAALEALGCCKEIYRNMSVDSDSAIRTIFFHHISEIDRGWSI